jgi:hypothetical protein
MLCIECQSTRRQPNSSILCTSSSWRCSIPKGRRRPLQRRPLRAKPLNKRVMCRGRLLVLSTCSQSLPSSTRSGQYSPRFLRSPAAPAPLRLKRSPPPSLAPAPTGSLISSSSATLLTATRRYFPSHSTNPFLPFHLTQQPGPLPRNSHRQGACRSYIYDSRQPRMFARFARLVFIRVGKQRARRVWLTIGMQASAGTATTSGVQSARRDAA